MKKVLAIGYDNQKLDVGILLLRVAISILMIMHGFPKMIKLFSNEPIAFVDFLGLGATTSLALAVFAEVFCSVLVFLGLATRLAVIPLIITMSVILFQVHVDDLFSVKEKPLLFLIIFLLLFITGSGRYSIDKLIHKR